MVLAMGEYAVFLRGVNVNGITIRTPDLLQTLGTLPLAGVKTFLASGNVTCSSQLDPGPLREQVQAALRRDFGYEAWVVVLTLDRLAELVAEVPYPADDPDVHSYVTFGSDPALLAELADAAAQAGAEQTLLGPEAVSWPQPKGATLENAMAKLGSKARFRASTTTRNVRTLQKMLAGRSPGA